MQAHQWTEFSQQAKVSKRTLYSHFENKEQLFQIMLITYWTSTLKDLQLEIDDDISPEKALMNFSLNLFEFSSQPDTGRLFRVLMNEYERFPTLVNIALDRKQSPFSRVLTDYLRKQTKNNILNVAEPNLAATQFIGMVKEYDFWPSLMGKQDELRPHKKLKKDIKLAIDIFLNYYKNE